MPNYTEIRRPNHSDTNHSDTTKTSGTVSHDRLVAYLISYLSLPCKNGTSRVSVLPVRSMCHWLIVLPVLALDLSGFCWTTVTQCNQAPRTGPRCIYQTWAQSIVEFWNQISCWWNIVYQKSHLRDRNRYTQAKFHSLYCTVLSNPPHKYHLQEKESIALCLI